MQLEAGDRPLFTGYGDDWVRLGEELIRTPFLLHRDRVSVWACEAWEALSLPHLEPVLAAPPEVLLLGSGRRLVFPAVELLEALAARGVGVECMDTRAAVRTYNLLALEGRLVSLAALPPDR